MIIEQMKGKLALNKELSEQVKRERQERTTAATQLLQVKLTLLSTFAFIIHASITTAIRN